MRFDFRVWSILTIIFSSLTLLFLLEDTPKIILFFSSVAVGYFLTSMIFAFKREFGRWFPEWPWKKE